MSGLSKVILTSYVYPEAGGIATNPSALPCLSSHTDGSSARRRITWSETLVRSDEQQTSIAYERMLHDLEARCREAIERSQMREVDEQLNPRRDYLQQFEKIRQIEADRQAYNRSPLPRTQREDRSDEDSW